MIFSWANFIASLLLRITHILPATVSWLRLGSNTAHDLKDPGFSIVVAFFSRRNGRP